MGKKLSKNGPLGSSTLAFRQVIRVSLIPRGKIICLLLLQIKQGIAEQPY